MVSRNDGETMYMSIRCVFQCRGLRRRCFFVAVLALQVPCEGPACIVSGVVIGFFGCEWLMEALKGDPSLRSVWDGTTMVGCSTLVRIDACESSEIAYSKLSGY